MTEAQIQSRIKERMKGRGWLVVKLLQTTMNGIPDLMAIKKGRVVFIEVKAVGKSPGLLQVLRHEMLRDAGVEVFVTDNKDFLL